MTGVRRAGTRIRSIIVMPRLRSFLAARAAARAWVAALPGRIVALTLALALAAGACVSLGAHYWFTVLPLAAALGAGGWWLLRPRGTVPTSAAIASLAALAIALTWIVVNSFWAAEYLLVVRDPGFLTLSGQWLVDHASTDIPTRGSIEAAAAQPNVIADASQAWNLRGDAVQPQGAKMLPAVMAVGGWIAGPTGVLLSAPVVGGLSLLAVFTVAARLVRPGLALVAMGTFALTVGHIGLGRAGYSEPLTLILVWGAILLAMVGVRHRDPWALLAAATVSGSTSLVRIDGAAFAAGLTIGVAIAVAAAPWRARRRALALCAFVALQALVLAGGYVALDRWSEAYLDRLWDEAALLMAGYAAVAAATTTAALAWMWLTRTDAPARRRRFVPVAAAWAGGLATATLVVLASRPLWMTSRRGTDSARHQFTNSVVESFQAAAGLEIDPTRTYAESTVTWLALHLTWPVVILAMAGVGILVHRMARGAWWLAVPLAALAAPTLLYLLRPSIVPDQIWAIRRLEPSGLPLLAVAAVAGLWLAAVLLRRTGWHVAAWGSLALLVLPVTTWVSIDLGSPRVVNGSSVIGITELDGSRDQLDALCALDPGRPIVLVRTSSHFGSLRVWCDVPVVLALVDPAPAALVEMTEAWGEAPLVLTTDEEAVEWTSAPSVVVDSTVYQTAFALQSLPTSYYDREYEWYAGVVGPDGLVEPLGPALTAASDG